MRPSLPALLQCASLTHRSRLLSHSLVDIYVGPDGDSYPVHEKLLCYHSPVLRRHFYAKNARNTTYGLDDEEPATFDLLLGFLYSGRLPPPIQEPDVGPLLDGYLLSQRLEMARLGEACVDAVRGYYQGRGTYPSLRRVQYVYEHTDEDNAMREMMVSSIARYLTLGDGIPKHWAAALGRNGPLAVDIIRAIQEWHLEGRSVPDAREGKHVGFSNIEGSSITGGSAYGDDTNGGMGSPQLSSP